MLQRLRTGHSRGLQSANANALLLDIQNWCRLVVVVLYRHTYSEGNNPAGFVAKKGVWVSPWTMRNLTCLNDLILLVNNDRNGAAFVRRG